MSEDLVFPGSTLLDPAKVKVLVLNDDGPCSKHFHHTKKGLDQLLHNSLYMIPHENKSAYSASITIGHEILVRTTAKDTLEVYGTPGDCALLAYRNFSLRPDIVISGINRGQNIGGDLVFSGTFNAAYCFTLCRILDENGDQAPFLAVSASSSSVDNTENEAIWLAQFVTSDKVARLSSVFPGLLLNINFGDSFESEKLKFISPGIRQYHEKQEPVHLDPGYMTMQRNVDIVHRSDQGELFYLAEGFITVSALLPSLSGYTDITEDVREIMESEP